MKITGIYSRILLLLILTGIFFLLLLITLHFITRKQEELMLKESQLQFNSEINSLITLKRATLKQVVYDYTFWDDFVENLKKSDTAWYTNNITTILKSYRFDFVCVYDTTFKVVHEASTGEVVSRDFISKEILAKLRDTRFINFFQVTADGLFEISGASIHPNLDPSHTLTKPSGYIFLAKSWNPVFFQELTILSGAKTHLLKPSDSLVTRNQYSISTVYELPGWNSVNVAQVVFTRTSYFLKLYHKISELMILLFLGSIITTGFIFHYTIRRWIKKPLKLVTSILKSDNLKQIGELQQSRGEFKDIGFLFGEFINQKDELRHAKEHAEKSERKFKNILDNSPFHIWEFDGEKFNYVNKAYTDFIGTGNSTAEKTDINVWTSYIHPDDLEEAMKIWVNAWENKREHDNYFRLLNKGGYYRDFWCHAVPIFDQEGKFKQFQGYNIDITERKQAEVEIHKLNETLEERVAERTSELETINNKLAFKNKELEQFTYIASHDLQEPLRTLTNFTQLFREEYAGMLDTDGNKYVEFISGSASRMRSLVKGLLDYSLLGKESILTVVDCNKIVREVLSDLTDSIKGSNAEISVQELPIVNGYETELRQLFQNLVTNAIKFRKKDVPPEIKISAENHEKEWIFAIEDNGIGIAEKDKEKIFIIFKRMHNRNEYEGTGIGLAHCKKIVVLHGGRIWVKSKQDVGSIFIFTIPK